MGVVKGGSCSAGASHALTPCTAPNTLLLLPLFPLPQAARAAGFSVVYGDGCRAAVLHAAGIHKPRALAVCLPGRVRDGAVVAHGNGA